ncbi:MAG TPA: enoyl-CoA hydratase/isomerase family protein [Acidimicrobiales bacterium]|nr:enoyl-CoA hydratase/isomerase family protein [Acidimicrobiales bacterium]
MRVEPAEAQRILAGSDWDPGDPLLVVEGAADLQVAPAFPAVVVVVDEVPGSAAGADVALCPPLPGSPALPPPWVGEPLDSLETSVSASPLAAVTLAQVLRLSARMSVEAGLAVESLAYSTLQGGPELARWLASRGTPRTVEDGGPAVIAERFGDTLAVTLNRPEVHNAYNAAMRDELCEALTVAVADPALAVELSGRGPSFCSGGDLGEFGTAPDSATAHLVRTARSPARLLWAVSERTTARLHGSCVGSGIELPAFAGTVLAESGTRIRLPEVSMGLIPGAGGTVSLPRRIGAARTAWLALSGSWIDAPTALAWGLVDAVLP